MYAKVCTRLDITHVVGTFSHFLSNPRRVHWDIMKWIIRYFLDTSSLKLYFGSEKPILTGHIDLDIAGDVDLRKSTSGYLIIFIGGAVAW